MPFFKQGIFLTGPQSPHHSISWIDEGTTKFRCGPVTGKSDEKKNILCVTTRNHWYFGMLRPVYVLRGRSKRQRFGKSLNNHDKWDKHFINFKY